MPNVRRADLDSLAAVLERLAERAADPHPPSLMLNREAWEAWMAEGLQLAREARNWAAGLGRI